MRVLVINAGSSTVKARFIDSVTHKVLGKGIADRIEMDLRDCGHEAHIESGLRFLTKWLKTTNERNQP